MSMSAKLRLS